jgi:hypothetical protein
MMQRGLTKKFLLKGNAIGTAFWIGWFRVMANGWDLDGLCRAAKKETVTQFVEKISPLPAFLYYLQAFHEVAKNPDWSANYLAAVSSNPANGAY